MSRVPGEPPPRRDAAAESSAQEAEDGEASRLETWLPRFSLDRRITVLVLMATFVVLGVVATLSIPLELIPSGFSESFLRVAAPWQDAPPQEVLDKVVLPLEGELSTVGGLSDVFSFARTGYGQVFMTFKHGTDMDVAYREVRDRVERARRELPEDLEQVFILKDNDASMPVAMVGITIDEGTTGVYDLIQNEVLLPLERIDGVASARAEGLVEKEILIELDRERVTASGLNIYEIAQDLARDNFTMASGHVRSGDRKLLLRSVARYRTPASVADVLIAPGVRLGDVASVRHDLPETEFSIRVNSRPALAIQVMKEGEANTLEVARRVGEVVEELSRKPRLRSLQMAMIMDQGDIIKESLSVLLSSGRVGAVFALLVLLFFLRRFRMSVIIALSIPISMVLALVVMYFAGESLNILSLLGLMISVGLLVDNSVVVAENIHRLHREGGISRRDAAIRGAGEIALAITTATLTTMVVFLPVSLVEGEGQFFLLRLAIPITVSLLASLLVALILVPLAVFLTLPAGGASRQGSASQRAHESANAVLRVAYDHTFGWLARIYAVSLRHFLRRRLDLILALVALFVLTSIVSRDRFEIVPMSEDDMPMFSMQIEMPRSVTFEETQAYFRRVEQQIESVKEEFGLDYYVVFHQRFQGNIQGAIASERASRISPRVMTERIVDMLPEMPGVEVRTGMMSETEEKTAAVESVTLFGEDAQQLDRLAKELDDVFLRLPGVIGLRAGEEARPNELALVLDRDRASQQGVDPQMVAGVVSYALRGQPLPRVYLGGRDIPVRVRYEEADREGLAQLGSFVVPTGEGLPVTLDSLVDVRQLPSASTIFRRNKQTAQRMVFELEDGKEEEARQAIWATMARIDLPEGVAFGPRIARGGDSEEARNLRFAAMLSILFVYLLMGFLFESFVLPLSILITIPLANLGVTWIHLLAGRPMDFLGLVGVIILIGVVVNNGIVLIDYVHRLRERGHDRSEALLLATERRFRPIMMTALTTICGMVPLTLSAPMQIGISYKSFGLTLIGGMVTSSLLTLLVVPVLYTLFEDARAALGRAVKAAFGGRREPEAPASEASVAGG
ncbi:MAG TPA: efflux RND transporter permease subunit [Thermoanaerobaculia bacterium]|nr:efflux RND transporter permease subunit [Thermoanaerobaculia bacterium]